MKNKFIFALALLVSLSSCTATDFRKAVGIEKKAPDEFMVLPRTKLAVPTTAVALPAPTEKVEGHIAASENARSALFGGESSGSKKPITSGENALLAKAGANDTDSSIRKTVNEEYKEKTGAFGVERGGTLEAVLDPFGYNSAKEPVVDPKAENKRIKEALAKGESITASKAVTKDPRKEKWESKKKKGEDEEKKSDDAADDAATEEAPAPLTDEEIRSGVH